MKNNQLILAKIIPWILVAVVLAGAVIAVWISSRNKTTEVIRPSMQDNAGQTPIPVEMQSPNYKIETQETAPPIR